MIVLVCGQHPSEWQARSVCCRPPCPSLRCHCICMWARICLWLPVRFGMRPLHPRGGGQVLLQSSEWNQITGPSVTSFGRRWREGGGGRAARGGGRGRGEATPPGELKGSLLRRTARVRKPGGRQSRLGGGTPCVPETPGSSPTPVTCSHLRPHLHGASERSGWNWFSLN